MNKPGSKIVMTLLTVALLAGAHADANAQVGKGFTDYHVHLQDSETVQLGYRMLKAIGQTPTKIDSIVLDADTIIERLDRAGFQDAWILSNAYWFGSPLTPIDNEYAAVKRQNDWTADQSAHYPGRLHAFMSVNPLKPYALEEIDRCAATGRFTGLKLHFANSQVDLRDTVQVRRLQKVFALANKDHLPILIHFRSGQKWDGAANARILLQRLMPYAPNIPVVIAHLAGWGGYDKPMDTALSLISAYIHQRNLPGNNLYLELSAVLPLTLNEDYKPLAPSAPPAQAQPHKLAWDPLPAMRRRIAQIGIGHILFGTDWPLIDIGPYIGLLNAALGKPAVQQILRNKIVY